jgi:hypothetical protein
MTDEEGLMLAQMARDALAEMEAGGLLAAAGIEPRHVREDALAALRALAVPEGELPTAEAVRAARDVLNWASGPERLN